VFLTIILLKWRIGLAPNNVSKWQMGLNLAFKVLIDKTVFKVCQAVHHHTFQMNQPTGCKTFSSLLLEVYVQFNMFWASSRPSTGAQQLQ